MSNLRGTAMSSMRERRVTYLLAHPDLWQHLPSDAQDVDTDEQRRGLVLLGTQMVIVGLYSKSTLVPDRNWGLRVLIGEARRRRAA